MITHRPGALERVALLLGDWLETHRRLVDTEARMTTVLDALQLTELAYAGTDDSRGTDPKALTQNVLR